MPLMVNDSIFHLCDILNVEVFVQIQDIFIDSTTQQKLIFLKSVDEKICDRSSSRSFFLSFNVAAQF